ncbi:MAG: HNH endonuclease signature motif containing protein [Actinomycetota bacterium]
MGRSAYLSSLNKEERTALEQKLFDRQSGKCFICDETLDLVLQAGQLDIDHIDPLAEAGLDDENNFAITHAACNRSKGASDLRVARRMAEFDKLQREAQARGERGATLADVLAKYGGASNPLRIELNDDEARYAIFRGGADQIESSPLYTDPLSKMQYFFAVLPLEYLHHDDRINPRSIGSNIRGLIEEFMKGNPQLHVSLAWWEPGADGAGAIKVFDGQHKAAAQILLGVHELPVRVFVKPDLNVMLQANTNAGDKLRQIAFDTAVLRHLGSTLFAERVHLYQHMKELPDDDYSFSEQDLVQFFKGEHREMLRYVVDAVRDSVSHNKDNKLMEFVEWSGKAADRPLAYSAIERTFFKEFVYKKALSTSLDEGLERGDNPRSLEREQIVRLMNTFADVFFVGHWDPEVGGKKLEDRLRSGDPIPENHLRAWRVAREEILANIVQWLRLVMENYFAFTGQLIEKDRIMESQLPEDLWRRLELFLQNLAGLPCWIDKNLSGTVFGAKQPLDFWFTIFKSGTAPNGVKVLAKPLDVATMIQEPAAAPMAVS